MKLKEYRKGHLRHADGSMYMERYGLFETTHLSARVHHICTEDIDRVLHDHPWPFISVVLRGGYTEKLPSSFFPCFSNGREKTHERIRTRGSVAYMPANGRHKISYVQPDTWTLFIYGKFVQDWGFYLPVGKVFWKDYLASGSSTFSPTNNTPDNMGDVFFHRHIQDDLNARLNRSRPYGSE